MHNATHIVHTYILAKNTHIYAATGAARGAAPATAAPIHSICNVEVTFMHLGCSTLEVTETVTKAAEIAILCTILVYATFRPYIHPSTLKITYYYYGSF